MVGQRVTPSADTLDLSEKNLVNLKGDAYAHGIVGGDIYSPIGYLARWQGAVEESLDPYPTSGKTLETFGSSPELMPCCYVSKIVLLPMRTDLSSGDWSAALYDGTHRFFRVQVTPKTAFHFRCCL